MNVHGRLCKEGVIFQETTFMLQEDNSRLALTVIITAKIQEQKTQESCRAAAPGDLPRRGQTDMPNVTQFLAILF